MKQTIIVPRRKIYEHLLILEDFILDIERFVLYDKESMAIYEYSNNTEFEPLLHDLIIKTIHLSNIFFNKKVFHSTQEFEQELQLQYKRDTKRCIDEFVTNISTVFNLEEYNELVQLLLDFIKNNKRWGKSRELTSQFFKLIDSYHTLLIKIIEIPSET
ncbi:MAG: hypothetical protein LAT82_04435 [Nanoarchaeota archaeon]|nr:hypothetical protein [Nanoarchaeota archaeon]